MTVTKTIRLLFAVHQHWREDDNFHDYRGVKTQSKNITNHILIQNGTKTVELHNCLILL